jgi:DNA-binding SARP family transcriptional activator
MPLRISTLGPFTIQHNDEEIPASAWGSQQTRTVLKMLLTRRSHVVSADQLVDILWPDDDPDTARNRLHVRISQLRRALAPENPSAYILTHRGGYGFNPEADCWIDAVEFEARAEWGRRCQECENLSEAIAAYETACALYRGDFLEEELYEDWTLAERERLRERFLTVLTELAECQARQGYYRRAIARCRQVLAIDACRETVYVRLMLYHYHAGEQSQALRTYERCCRILAEEMGVEPLPQTTDLYRQLLHQDISAGEVHYPEPAYEERLTEAPHSLGQMPFVGREDEYARLAASVKRAVGGNGGLAIISGRAGIGKTRFVHKVLGYARQLGASTIEGRGFELARALSYQPFVQALRSYVPTADPRHLREVPGIWLAETSTLLPELSSLFPDLRPNAPLPPQHRKNRLFEGLTQFILHVSRKQPLVIFIDDLHWIDRPTLELLHYVARHITAEKVLLIGTFRSEEVTKDHALNELLRGVNRTQMLARIELPSLTEEVITDLITQIAHSPTGNGPFARLIYRETAGNPLFITATLQNLFENGLLHIDEEGKWLFEDAAFIADDQDLAIPPTIQEVIEARLARLDTASRCLLAAASVLGQEFDPEYLQKVSGFNDEVHFQALDNLLRRNLIQEGAGVHRYRFDHSKVQEVTYAGLDAPQRATLHRKVGRVLEELYQNRLEKVAGQLAQHFRLAGEPSPTIKYSIMAGQETLHTCDHQETVTYLQQALTVAEEANLPLTRTQYLVVQRGLGDAYWISGRYNLARACYKKALSSAETPVEMDGLGFKVAYLDAQQGIPISSLLQRAETFQNELKTGQSPLVESRHYLQKGYTLLVHGAANEARQCYQRGWDIVCDLARTANKEQHLFDLAEAHRARGEAHLYWGEYNQSAHDLEQALSIYQEIGALPGTMRSHLFLAELLVHTGDWDSAQTTFEQVVETATRVEHKPLLAEALFRLGYIHCDQGEWELAESEAHRSQAIAENTGDLVSQSGAQFLLNRILIKRGQAERALPSCQAIELAMRAVDSGLYLCLALRYLAEAYVSLKEPDKALSHCREGLDLGHRADFKREIGAIQRVCGEALIQQHEWDDAEAHLQASVEQLERTGSLYELGESHRSLGRLQNKRGTSDAALEHLTTALTLFEKLGAKHDIATTQKLMAE